MRTASQMFVRTTLVLGPLGLCPSFPPSLPPANRCSLGLGGGGPGSGATSLCAPVNGLCRVDRPWWGLNPAYAVCLGGGCCLTHYRLQ